MPGPGAAGQHPAGHRLVHEAYLRLVGDQAGRPRNGRGHFFGAAAEAMRRILIDQAQRKCRPKHGGDRDRMDLDGLAIPPADDRTHDLLALDDALTDFAREERAKASWSSSGTSPD